jgi:H+/Cl- antiporter ClcA
LSLLIGALAYLIARALLLGINFFTDLFYFQTLSLHDTKPDLQHLGWPSIFIPVIGAFLVGLMARFGSKAIRGHGIPEAMEKILIEESRIPRRIMILKPLSSAIAIVFVRKWLFPS